MLTENQTKQITNTNAVTETLIENAIKQINNKYSTDYHKQNPHLLSTFIELHKDIYLATINNS